MQLNNHHAASTLVQDSYHDVNNLQRLKNINIDSNSALEEIGKQFESLLVHQMLKSMRSATNVWAKDSIFNSERTAFYQDMLDDQMSIEIVRSQNLGLSQKIAADMQTGVMNSVENTELKESSSKTSLYNPDKNHDAIQFGGVQKARYDDKAHYDDAGMHLSSIASVNISDGKDSGLNKQAEPKANNQALAINSEMSVNQSFDIPEAFIAEIMPLAKKASEALNVPAEKLVAQAALETGWGKHVIRNADGSTSHNLFGIKADNRWSGNSATVQTLEYFDGQPVNVAAQFRSYDSYASSFDDYVRFIQGNERYQPALAKADKYAEQLQHAGYATDPHYAEKINRIVEQIREP